MDAVSRAISKGLHISKIEKLNSQSWEEFEQKVENRKLFLFGTGVCAGFFWDKYEAMIPLAGVIDNSKEISKETRNIRRSGIDFKKTHML